VRVYDLLEVEAGASKGTPAKPNESQKSPGEGKSKEIRGEQNLKCVDVYV